MIILSGPDLLRAEFDLLGFTFICIADPDRLVRAALRPPDSDCAMLRNIPEGMNYPLKSAETFINNYLSGSDSAVPLPDLSSFLEKEQSVYAACITVGFGDRISYGSLARAAGLPGAARFAGSCMRKNIFPVFIPCHRVVPSTGGIGFYSGGEDIKAKLLSFEESLRRR
jgi:methylated-DNA-[protein]-cysteine S-methyltransferase